MYRNMFHAFFLGKSTFSTYFLIYLSGKMAIYPEVRTIFQIISVIKFYVMSFMSYKLVCKMDVIVACAYVRRYIFLRNAFN